MLSVLGSRTHFVSRTGLSEGHLSSQSNFARIYRKNASWWWAFSRPNPLLPTLDPCARVGSPILIRRFAPSSRTQLTLVVVVLVLGVCCRKIAAQQRRFFFYTNSQSQIPNTHWTLCYAAASHRRTAMRWSRTHSTQYGCSLELTHYGRRSESREWARSQKKNAGIKIFRTNSGFVQCNRFGSASVPMTAANEGSRSRRLQQSLPPPSEIRPRW